MSIHHKYCKSLHLNKFDTKIFRTKFLIFVDGDIPRATSYGVYYIEDIYFFEVNTKYISSNVSKISAFLTSA